MRAVWRVDSVVISDIMWNATLWLHSIIKTFLWLLFELSALDHLIKGWRCLNCCLCTNPKENMQVKEKLQFITTYSSKYWPWSQDYGGISECDDVHVVRKVKKTFPHALSSQSSRSYLCVQLSATLWMPACKYWMNLCAVYIIHPLLSWRCAFEWTCKRYKHIALHTNWFISKILTLRFKQR